MEFHIRSPYVILELLLSEWSDLFSGTLKTGCPGPRDYGAFKPTLKAAFASRFRTWAYQDEEVDGKSALPTSLIVLYSQSRMPVWTVTSFTCFLASQLPKGDKISCAPVAEKLHRGVLYWASYPFPPKEGDRLTEDAMFRATMFLTGQDSPLYIMSRLQRSTYFVVRARDPDIDHQNTFKSFSDPPEYSPRMLEVPNSDVVDSLEALQPVKISRA